MRVPRFFVGNGAALASSDPRKADWRNRPVTSNGHNLAGPTPRGVVLPLTHSGPGNYLGPFAPQVANVFFVVAASPQVVRKGRVGGYLRKQRASLPTETPPCPRAAPGAGRPAGPPVPSSRARNLPRTHPPPWAFFKRSSERPLGARAPRCAFPPRPTYPDRATNAQAVPPPNLRRVREGARETVGPRPTVPRSGPAARAPSSPPN